MNSKLFQNDAEMAVLGAMFLSDRAMQEAFALLRVDDFYRPSHRRIFEAMTKAAKSDYVGIKDALGSNLSDSGGEDYLLHLAQFVPSAANISYYAGIVSEASQRRSIRSLAEAIVKMADDEEVATETLVAESSRLGSKTLKADSPWLNIGSVPLSEHGDKGVSTGFSALDALITTKGYPSGQMTALRASHKAGKTTIMLSSASKLATLGLRVGYATFADLSSEQLKRRLVRQLCGCSKPSQTDAVAAEEFRQALRDMDLCWDLQIYDAGRVESTDVEVFAAWFKAEHGRKPFDILFLDYAQEITTNAIKDGNEQASQAKVAQVVNLLAKSANIPFVVGSQTTKGTDGAPAKTKWSRAWEEKAGWVLSLEREPDAQLATVTVEYSRFGYQARSVTLRFLEDYLRFDDYVR